MEPELLAQLADALPAPPVTGYSGWWDASDLASIQVATGGKVATWKDRTGSGRDATQSVDANRPRTGSWTQNGRNVVWASGQTILSGPQPGLTAQPWTVFLVARSDWANATQADAFTVWVSGNEWGRIYRTAADAIAIYAGGGFSSSQNWQTGRPRVVSAVFNGASSTIGVDGRYTSAGAVPNQGSSPSWSIFSWPNGITENWSGWVGEIIFYPRQLTAIEIQRVESYLRTKWGLT